MDPKSNGEFSASRFDRAQLIRDIQATGTYRQSFTADHLSNPEITAEEEALVRLAGASLFFAGFDTVRDHRSRLHACLTLISEV